MTNLRNAGPGTNPNSSVIPRNRKNSRKNRKNSRKNTRKQRGGAAGIFQTRFTGPAKRAVGVANELLDTEIRAVRKVVNGVFDGVATAVNGLGRGADGLVRSAVNVISRKNRH